MILQEGLKKGDLAHLINPLISIDEYSSKLAKNEEVIVVTFSAKDEDPAKDLNGFIQKGNLKILDTEVSPSPDIDGDYLIFVEFIRDEKFPKELIELVNSIKSLTNIKNWKLKPYKVSQILDLTEENIKKYICLDKKEYLKKTVKEFLQHSYIIRHNLRHNILLLESYNKKSILKFVDFGDINIIMKRHKLINKPLQFTEELNRHFGSNWFINKVENFIIISKIDTDNILLLKKV